MYLLDTVFVSELRRSAPDQNVSAWTSMYDPSEGHLSVLTIGEILKGAERVRDKDMHFYGEIISWVESIEKSYETRLIPITRNIAKRYGVLARVKTIEEKCGQIDILLAATAIECGLTIVTRNVDHFVILGVPIINPWAPIGAPEFQPPIQIRQP